MLVGAEEYQKYFKTNGWMIFQTKSLVNSRGADQHWAVAEEKKKGEISRTNEFREQGRIS